MPEGQVRGPCRDSQVAECHIENCLWETPLALGENAIGETDFERVVASADVVQPDITKTCGITDGLVVGRRVVAAGKKLCFHMFGGGVGLYASAHLTAAIDGAHWLEMDANPNPLLSDMLAEPPRIEDGALLLSQKPGIGIDLAPQALERWRVQV